jgi:hypothetical protein
MGLSRLAMAAMVTCICKSKDSVIRVLVSLTGCGKTVSSHGEICTDQHISIQDQAFEGQIQ